jgi:hypothetical protein
LAVKRIPLPVLAVLGLLLVAGPVGLLLGGRQRHAPAPRATLADIARHAGCTLKELDGRAASSNPPVTGRFLERVLAADGSYMGRRSPSPLATMHALLHGRVLFQYRPGVGRAEVGALDRLVRHDPVRVLLFQNQTRMQPRVAATAYLSVMTCPRVDRDTLRAFAAFRDRRRAFGQGF